MGKDEQFTYNSITIIIPQQELPLLYLPKKYLFSVLNVRILKMMLSLKKLKPD
jgi:hypothetical protein